MADKGLYESLVDGLVKAVGAALAVALGYAYRLNQEEREALKAEIERLNQDAEIRRRRADVSERQRVQDKFKDQ